jgi:hypothetical protein
MSSYRIDKYGDDFWFVQANGHLAGTVVGRFKSLGFEAQLYQRSDGTSESLGRFPSKEDAAEALVEASVQKYGTTA